MNGRVLIIAGSDSGGGAGIQADIKTVIALGGYAATAVTALTAQNTLGVQGIVEIDPSFVALQIRVVMADIGADVIKVGMLGSARIIEAVEAELENRGIGLPLVVDPVMVAKGGAMLLAPESVLALKQRLIAKADLVTPNIPEAGALTGLEIRDLEDMRRAAGLILSLGAKAVLVKGGHLAANQVIDLLVTDDGEETFESPRIITPHTHGTGCTLASAIAAGMACGLGIREAVARGRRYVFRAIETAPGIGHGHGPLNHGHTVALFQ